MHKIRERSVLERRSYRLVLHPEIRETAREQRHEASGRSIDRSMRFAFAQRCVVVRCFRHNARSPRQKITADTIVVVVVVGVMRIVEATPPNVQGVRPLLARVLGADISVASYFLCEISFGMLNHVDRTRCRSFGGISDRPC